MAKTTYYTSPFGVGIHCHLNTADSKFAPDNPTYKTKLKLEGEVAQSLKAKVDAAVDEAFTAHFEEGGKGADIAPKDRKKWSPYHPYEEEEDDAGNKTGAILFDFKQNAKIRLKDGTVKDIQMPLYDSQDNPVHKLIRTGSVIRVAYSMRPIVMTSTKQVGIRLDFAKVQVKKLAEGGSSGGGFGAVEDGYVEDEHGGGFGSDGAETAGSASGNVSGDY